jgi:predicted aminopeptidase
MSARSPDKREGRQHPRTTGPEVEAPTATRSMIPGRSDRRRYYPPRPRRRPSWCATIAALSAELGSLEAVFAQLDSERAARVALAQARRDRVVDAVERVKWVAEQEQRYQAWRAAPLQVPEWAVRGIVEGWPEP